ncbi:MAG: hypothetical protein AB7K08_11145 [Microbacteriaceae bacterium]
MRSVAVIVLTAMTIGVVAAIGTAAVAVAMLPGESAGEAQPIQAIAVEGQEASAGAALTAVIGGAPLVANPPKPVAIGDGIVTGNDTRPDGAATPATPADPGQAGEPATPATPADPATGNGNSGDNGNSGNAGKPDNSNSGPGNNSGNSDKAAKDAAKEAEKQAKEQAKADKEAKKDKH